MPRNIVIMLIRCNPQALPKQYWVLVVRDENRNPMGAPSSYSNPTLLFVAHVPTMLTAAISNLIVTGKFNVVYDFLI